MSKITNVGIALVQVFIDEKWKKNNASKLPASYKDCMIIYCCKLLFILFW